MFKPDVGLIGIGKWGNILKEKLKKKILDSDKFTIF